MGTVPSRATIEKRLAAFKHSLRDAVDHGTERATRFKAQAIEAEHAAEARVRPALDKVTTMIVQYPLTAVAIGVGLGYSLFRLRR